MDLAIAYISFLSVVAPIAIGFYGLNKLGFQFKALLLVCIISIVSDSFALLLLSYSINNWPVLNLFSVAQIAILLVVLDADLKIKWNKFVLVVFVLFSIFNLLFIQSFRVFNSYSSYFGAVLLITFSLIYLYRLLRDLPTIDIYKFPPLWIVFAILTYYGGTLFLFLFNNYLLSTNLVTHKSIWMLHNSLNILKNLLFALALWQHHRSVRLSH